MIRCSHKESQTHKTAATATEGQEAEHVDDDQSDKGEQVGHWVAAATITRVTGAVPILVLIIEPEHPHTADDDPYEQEQGNKTLQAAAGFPPVVCALFLALVFAQTHLEDPLGDIDECGHQAEDAEHNKPYGDVALAFAVIQVD